MIGRLRKRFIVLTMCSLAVVLTTIIGLVNFANFAQLDRDATQLLSLLAENGGYFPKMGKHDGKSGPPSRPISPEAPYETRYFTVLWGENGTATAVNTGSIAAISTEDALELAQGLWARGRTSGYSGNYKYLASPTREGTLYIFLDCRRDLASFRTFFSMSLVVSGCGMLAVFLLVLFFSKKAVAPVAESYEKQKQFITNAGYEIKTPLAIIDSCAEVLELEQGESKWTQSIRNQVGRLASLTESLVALTRMDEGGSKPAMVDFSLSDAVLESAEPFLLLSRNCGKTLEPDIEPGITCHGDEASLRRLVSILLDNAVKYALPDSPIRLSLKKQGRRIAFCCRNAADGLEKGSQDRLFDRFYRGDASRSSETGGYGIGLSMAQAIVSAHGGRISAWSDDGASLTITVLLS